MQKIVKIQKNILFSSFQRYYQTNMQFEPPVYDFENNNSNAKLKKKERKYFLHLKKYLKYNDNDANRMIIPFKLINENIQDKKDFSLYTQKTFLEIINKKNLYNSFEVFNFFSKYLSKNCVSLEMLDELLIMSFNLIKFHHLEANHNLSVKYSMKIMQIVHKITKQNLDLINFENCLTIMKILLYNSKKNLNSVTCPLKNEIVQNILKRLDHLLSLDVIDKSKEKISLLLYHISFFEKCVVPKNLNKFFENFVIDNYKTFSEKETLNLLYFYLNEKFASPYFFENKYINLFYFSFLRGSKYYWREYALHRLKITKIENTLLKNFRIFATRIFLSNFGSKEPKYIKHFNFTLKDLLEINKLIVKNSFFVKNNSILFYLQDLIFEKVFNVYHLEIKGNLNNEIGFRKFWNNFVKIQIDLLESQNIVFLQNKQNLFLIQMLFSYAINNFAELKFWEIVNLLIFFKKSNLIKDNIENLVSPDQIQTCKKLLENKLDALLKNVDISKRYILRNTSFLLQAIIFSLENQTLESVYPFLKLYFKKIIYNLDKYKKNEILMFLDVFKSLFNKNEEEHALRLTEKILVLLRKDRDLLVIFSNNIDIFFQSLNLFLTFTSNLVEFGSAREIDLQNANILNDFFISKIFQLESENITPDRLYQLLEILYLMQKCFYHTDPVFSSRFNELHKFTLRFLSDNYQKIEIALFEKILIKILDLYDPFINFDDGSNLYNNNIIEETKQYIEEHWMDFSQDFRNVFKDLNMTD